MPPLSTTKTWNPSPDGTSAAIGTVTARAWTAVTTLPNTDSPIRSGLAGRPMRARTATARELESTAAPTAVTEPCPTASPPSPAVTPTESPAWIRAACAGLTLKTTSKAATSATSTSGWFASTAAPSTAVIRVTTPAKGARSVASCCARRRVKWRPLELDQGISLCHALAGGDEDARHSCGRGGRELREVPRSRGHGADGAHHLREGLLGGDRRSHAAHRLLGRRRVGGACLALRTTGREPQRRGDEARPGGHGGSVVVRSRTAAAASFAAATSST